MDQAKSEQLLKALDILTGDDRWRFALYGGMLAPVRAELHIETYVGPIRGREPYQAVRDIATKVQLLSEKLRAIGM